MAVTVCGWCGERSHMTPRGAGYVVQHEGEVRPLLQSLFRCDSCLRVLVGGGFGDVPHNFSTDSSVSIAYWTRIEPTHWAPQFVKGQTFADVPEHIGAAASEAHKSYSISSFMSAVLMARTVIEAVAKEKGITDGNLYVKIDKMAGAGLIKDFTRETAHLIRIFGNDMAHGDISIPIDKSDAEGVIEFMDELLSEVFQNPARLARLQARARERTGKG